MKAVKIIALVLVILIAIVVAVVIAAFVFIDSVARNGIEQGASYALDVQTTLDSADVDVFGGEFELAGLTIANPEGYSTPHFFMLDSGSASLDLDSLRGDTVELPTLVLDGIDVYLDKEDGKANYAKILENLKRFESGEAPKDTEADPNATGKTFVIREVKILNVTAHIELLPIGGSLSTAEVVVPEIILQNVGQDDPLTIAKLTNVIVKAVFASIINVGGDALPGAITEGLNAGLGGLTDLATSGIGMGVDLGEGVINVVGDVGGAATEALGDAAGAVGEGVEDATDAVEDGVNRVRGLFGGGDEEDEPQTDGEQTEDETDDGGG